MAEYKRSEAREWALDNMHGVCGCLLPTLNSSLTQVNEAAIRHDVRREKELGFWGTLLVSECGTTLPEMRRVIDVAVDEASSVGLRTMLLASFPTLDETIEMTRYAESAGVDLVLLSYPLTYFPVSEDEVFQFTKEVAASTSLGLMLFCIDLWGFDRLHPSGFSSELIGRLVDEVDNVVAIKNEVGEPGVAGIAEVFRRYRERVVVSDPFEQNAPAWSDAFGMSFLGTSNYEYLGAEVPKYFQLLQAGKYDDAMRAYWRLHPARTANAKLGGEAAAGTRIVHRMVWKYQYWLNGFNGGPIRQPHLRMSDAQMRAARNGLLASGFEPVGDDDADFFVGRNPME